MATLYFEKKKFSLILMLSNLFFQSAWFLKFLSPQFERGERKLLDSGDGEKKFWLTLI